MRLATLGSVVLTLAAFTVAGCGQSSPPAQADKETPAPAQPAAATAQPAAAAQPANSSSAEPAGGVERRDGVAIVRITGDDAMRYNINQFTLKAGEKVRLVFKHTGRLAASVMGHNVVILKLGEDPQAFATQVPTSGGNASNDYLPPSFMDRVLVHTKLIGGGQQTTVEFTAPDPGEYPFLCTFPGHFAMMNGKMIVEAP